MQCNHLGGMIHVLRYYMDHSPQMVAHCGQSRAHENGFHIYALWTRTWQVAMPERGCFCFQFGPSGLISWKVNLGAGQVELVDI